MVSQGKGLVISQGQHNNTTVFRLKRKLQGAYELIGKLTSELAGFKKKNGNWK